LPYFGSSPGAWTIFTRAQSASISSARTIGTLVLEPVPISERWATIVTVPSGAIETNTSGLVTMPFGMSRPPVWYCSNAPALLNGTSCMATTKPIPEAVPLRNARRLTFSMRTRSPTAMDARASCSFR
jgi:hypothetical protein